MAPVNCRDPSLQNGLRMTSRLFRAHRGRAADLQNRSALPPDGFLHPAEDQRWHQRMAFERLPDDNFEMGMILLSGGDQLGQIAAQMKPDGKEIGNDDESFK